MLFSCKTNKIFARTTNPTEVLFLRPLYPTSLERHKNILPISKHLTLAQKFWSKRHIENTWRPKYGENINAKDAFILSKSNQKSLAADVTHVSGVHQSWRLYSKMRCVHAILQNRARFKACGAKITQGILTSLKAFADLRCWRLLLESANLVR